VTGYDRASVSVDGVTLAASAADAAHGADASAPDGRLAALQGDIDRLFGTGRLSEIRRNLQAEDGAFARDALAALGRGAPLSMACCIRMMQMLRADGPRLGAALDLEYRYTFRAMEHGDFLEGIRAQIIDKDRRPAWKYADGDVPAEAVDRMLAPLGPDALELDQGSET
jgi:hypothetical protein